MGLLKRTKKIPKKFLGSPADVDGKQASLVPYIGCD